jgi:hypothetical protein
VVNRQITTNIQGVEYLLGRRHLVALIAPLVLDQTVIVSFLKVVCPNVVRSGKIKPFSSQRRNEEGCTRNSAAKAAIP